MPRAKISLKESLCSSVPSVSLCKIVDTPDDFLAILATWRFRLMA